MLDKPPTQTTMAHIHHTSVEFDFNTCTFPIASVGPVKLEFHVDESSKRGHDKTIVFEKTVFTGDILKLEGDYLIVTLIRIGADNTVYRFQRSNRILEFNFNVDTLLGDKIRCFLDVVYLGTPTICSPPRNIHNVTPTDLSPLSDLQILCDDGTWIRAFKVLLAQRSPVFATMFTNLSFNQSNELSIHDASSKDVEKMVNITLSSELPNVGVDDVDFVLLCDRYGFSNIVDRWVYVASTQIDNENAIRIMRVAELLNIESLLDKSMKYIKTNPLVSNLDDLTKDELVRIIKINI